MARFEDIPLVKDFMKTRVLTANEGDDVLEAARALLEAGHSGAPVLDGDGKLVGVLSEVDCVRVMSSAAFHGRLGPRETTVRAQMTREVETISASADLFSCVQHFTIGHHRRLPVVEDGKLVGLVTRRDVLKALDTRLRKIDQGERHSTYDDISSRR